jgi:hypothetical protein
MVNMWYNKLHEAKKAKATRINTNKARLVKRTIIRLWGKTAGEKWFSGTKWAQYLDPLQNPSKQYTYENLLVGNPYVIAEADRRSKFDAQFEGSVRAYVSHLNNWNMRTHYVAALKEAIVRIERNDWVFEHAVRKLMDA